MSPAQGQASPTPTSQRGLYSMVPGFWALSSQAGTWRSQSEEGMTCGPESAHHSPLRPSLSLGGICFPRQETHQHKPWEESSAIWGRRRIRKQILLPADCRAPFPFWISAVLHSILLPGALKYWSKRHYKRSPRRDQSTHACVLVRVLAGLRLICWR